MLTLVPVIEIGDGTAYRLVRGKNQVSRRPTTLAV